MFSQVPGPFQGVSRVQVSSEVGMSMPGTRSLLGWVGIPGTRSLPGDTEGFIGTDI